MDFVKVSIIAPTDFIVGGTVASTGDYSTNPTTTVTGYGLGLETGYSFVRFDMSDIPEYAISAMKSGLAKLTAQFETSTSSISRVNVKVFASDESIQQFAVRDFLAQPGDSTSARVYSGLAGNSSNPLASINVKTDGGPAFPSENQHWSHTVDVTSQGLQAIHDGIDLLVYFEGTGGAVGVSTNITQISAKVVGAGTNGEVLYLPDNMSDANKDVSLVGSISTKPFSGVTLSTKIPQSLYPNADGSINIPVRNPEAQETDFIDASTPSKGTNTYLIVQSNKNSGVLSGQGLTAVDPAQFGYPNSAGYMFSGSSELASKLLQQLIFTPNANASQQTRSTNFTIVEAIVGNSFTTPLGSVEFSTGSITGQKFGGGATQLVTTGGVANQSTLDGFVSADASGTRAYYGTQIVKSGGVANATNVIAGVVNVQDGGISNDTNLGNSGQAAIGNVSTPSQENVSGGGVANRTSIDTGASQNLTAGGTANHTSIKSGGLQSVGSASHAFDTHILSGGVETVAAGGASAGAVIDAGGRQDVSGFSLNAQVAGIQNVLTGGQANNSAIASGGVQNVSGTTDSTKIQAGGTENVLSGGSASRTSVSGTSAVLTIASGGSAKDVSLEKGAAVTVSGTASLAGLTGEDTTSLQKTGAGLSSLSGALKFTGTTNVSGGTLLVASDNSLRDGKAIVLAGGTLEVGDGFVSGGALQLPGNGTVQVDGGTATLSGSLGGPGTLTKTGGGTLKLTGNYNVNITLTSGTLELAGSTTAGTVAFGASSFATLKLDDLTKLPSAITGFGLGNTLDLPTLSYSQNGKVSLANGVLTISDGASSKTVVTLSLDASLGQGVAPVYGKDGAGHVAITLDGIGTGGPTNSSGGYAGVPGSLQSASWDPPAISGLTSATDSGQAGDGQTTITKPAISGTSAAGAGETVTLYLDGGTTPLGTTMTNAGGAWTYQFASDLPTGPHTVTATLTHGGTTQSLNSSPYLLTINPMPAAPLVIGLTAATDTGNSQTDGVTDQTSIGVRGTGIVGARIDVYVDGGTSSVGTTTVDSNGSWKIDQLNATLKNGAHAITATQIDPNGNTSASSAAYATKIVTLPPDAPTLVLNADTGSSQSDGLTKDPTLVFTPSAQGDTLLYSTDGTTYTTSAPFFATDGTDDGPHKIFVKEQDEFRNVSAPRSVAFTLDTTAPVAPTGLAVAGQSATGMAEKGSTVTIYDGIKKLGTTSADTTTGAFSYALGQLADGNHSLTATATDAAGNTGLATAQAIVFTVDTTPVPSTPSTSGSSSSQANQTLPSTGGTVSPAAGTTVTASDITNGAVTVAGQGTVVLTGTNTYTGPTSVQSGKLVVDGSIVSPVTVNSGATLGGSGSTGSVSVQSGGAVAPGNSPGILSTKDLSLAAGAMLKEEIGGVTSGQFDQLKVQGSVTLTGSKLDVSSFANFASARGDSFKIIDNDGTDAVVGTFAGLAEGAIVSFGARDLRISYHGGDGNDVTLTDTTGLTFQPAKFGETVTNANSAAGTIYALYEGLLHRAPDASGLTSFTTAIENGASLKDVARTILASTENVQQAQDAGGYVQSLYLNILNRPADTAGLTAWTSALNAGASRVDIAVQFATSAEAKAVLAPIFANGVFVVDASEASVARLYYGLLDRAPDAAGLQAFSTAIETGGGGAAGEAARLGKVVSAILSSSEYSGKHAAQSDTAFIADLYQHALGRAPDTAGATYFSSNLTHGGTRAQVAFEVTQSAEAQVHLLGVIKDGMLLAA